MRVLHVVSSISPEIGGPAKLVSEMAEALVQRGIEVSVFASVKKEDERTIMKPAGVNLKLFRQSFFARWWPFYSPEYSMTIRREACMFDLIHIHELWHYPHYAAYKAAKEAQKPYIISIHGALDTWCLKYKSFKKKIYASLIQRPILRQASAIHAITAEEMRHIQAFGRSNRIVVIPNGLNPEEFRNLPPKEQLQSLYPGVRGKKVILFLGRIHPKKGLDILARAFGKITAGRDDIRLLIIGPDTDGYQHKIEKILKREGVSDKVIFTGMLTGYGKLAALGGADLFVLPSYSEGFSMAILEAMICGIPVVITHQCHFPEVGEVKAGEIIQPDVSKLTKALIKLLDNPQLCRELGENGRRLVLKKLTLNRIAAQMVKLYTDVLRENSSSKCSKLIRCISSSSGKRCTSD